MTDARTAFRLGHAPSVQRLFVYVCLMAEASNEAISDIKAQMEAEYGVSLDEAVAAFHAFRGD